MTSLKKLFSPIKIGTMEVRNRIVMPPINGPGWSAPDGSVSQRLINFHEAQAKGGVGLISVAGVNIDPLMQYGGLSVPLWDDKFIPGFGELAKAVHAHGAKLAPQVMHLGPIRNPALSGVEAAGPSAIPPKEVWHQHVPREMTVEEIEEMVEAFGEAARRAREAGCDAIEIHACHGVHHIVSSFMSPLSNKRSDAYGGSLEGMLRFPVEIIKSMKAKAGSDFPILMRISGDEIVPGGRTLLETQVIAPLLVEAGVNALHISGGTYPETSWWVLPPTGTPVGLNVSAAAAIKQAVSVPIIVAGRIKSPLLAEYIIASGKADMVSMGRALMADPELPNKAAAGRFEDIAPCISCNLGCIGAQAEGRMTCLVNPTVTREKEMALIRTEKPKKVMVVGGGPGGLEAARVAALRGHQVTLFEKTSKLGGQFNLAAVPPLVQENILLVQYLSTQVQKAGVKIELGREVTLSLVEEFKPDVVVVATGAAPLIPDDIPGVHKEKVVTAHDVLAGKAGVGAMKVVILGGGIVGCEVADFLAEPGDNYMVRSPAVTIIEVLSDIMQDMLAEPRYLLLQSLRRKGVKWITSAHIKEILDDRVVLVRDGQEEIIHGMDCIILALGAKSVDELSEKIKDKVAEVYVIGDAKEPRKALHAIAEAAEVARKI